jgi:hypothetical protein
MNGNRMYVCVLISARFARKGGAVMKTREYKEARKLLCEQLVEPYLDNLPMAKVFEYEQNNPATVLKICGEIMQRLKQRPISMGVYMPDLRSEFTKQLRDPKTEADFIEIACVLGLLACDFFDQGLLDVHAMAMDSEDAVVCHKTSMGDIAVEHVVKLPPDIEAMLSR